MSKEKWGKQVTQETLVFQAHRAREDHKGSEDLQDHKACQALRLVWVPQVCLAQMESLVQEEQRVNLVTLERKALWDHLDREAYQAWMAEMSMALKETKEQRGSLDS